MQIIDPMAIALVIPAIPVLPVNLSIRVAKRSVAIDIPETGLLLLPTRPTILEDTVAKKKPNTTTITAPRRLTGIAGISHTKSVRTIMDIITTLRFKSLLVRSLVVG